MTFFKRLKHRIFCLFFQRVQYDEKVVYLSFFFRMSLKQYCNNTQIVFIWTWPENPISIPLETESVATLTDMRPTLADGARVPPTTLSSSGRQPNRRPENSVWSDFCCKNQPSFRGCFCKCPAPPRGRSSLNGAPARFDCGTNKKGATIDL